MRRQAACKAENPALLTESKSISTVVSVPPHLSCGAAGSEAALRILNPAAWLETEKAGVPMALLPLGRLRFFRAILYDSQLTP
jgi:hypothetical protein